MSLHEKVTIRAKDAQAFDVAAGQRIRICTPKGYQATNFCIQRSTPKLL